MGCSHSFLKLWIESELCGEMTHEKYGKIWCLEHGLGIASFIMLDEKEMKKSFNWINLRPMYEKNIIVKCDKTDYLIYLLQEVKAKYVIKINVQEG